MSQNEFSTYGKEIYKDLEVTIFCQKDVDTLGPAKLPDRFRLVYLKEGHGVFQNGDKRQLFTSPMLFCLTEEDGALLVDVVACKMDILYFNPCGVYSTISYESIDSWREIKDNDKYFYRPFLNRTEQYLGAIPTNQYLGKRVVQLMDRVNMELCTQPDGFWPCRSRSYYIELLLLVNSIFEEAEQSKEELAPSLSNPVFVGKMTDEINELLHWLHVHYEEDLTIEDITKVFHTNKTTLNKKFKEVMGSTVMDYLYHLRMQVACSLLRKTYLTVKEITERSGYRDESHFLRSFKKYTGSTPSKYRNGQSL